LDVKLSIMCMVRLKMDKEVCIFNVKETEKVFMSIVIETKIQDKGEIQWHKILM
jgi:hypothetical protein